MKHFDLRGLAAGIRRENLRLPCCFALSNKCINDMHARIYTSAAIVALLYPTELFFSPFGIAESRTAGVDRPPCARSRLETGAISLRRDVHRRLSRYIAAPRLTRGHSLHREERKARSYYCCHYSQYAALVFPTYDRAMKSHGTHILCYPPFVAQRFGEYPSGTRRMPVRSKGGTPKVHGTNNLFDFSRSQTG